MNVHVDSNNGSVLLGEPLGGLKVHLKTFVLALLACALMYTETARAHGHDTGCTPSVNPQSVQLAPVSVWEFPHQGSVTGWTPFSIAFHGCKKHKKDIVKKQAWVYFHNINANPITGRLNNAGTAGGVQLQLTDAAGNPFKVMGSPQTPAGPQKSFFFNDTTLNYGVQYYRASAAPPTAGSVKSTTYFSLYFH